MRALLILGLCAAAAVGVYGERTSIQRYPFAASLLTSAERGLYLHACSGALLTHDAVLAAAHCFHETPAALQWRVRVGSTWANSGGAVHSVEVIIPHQSFDSATMDHDVAVLRTTTQFAYAAGAVSPALVASADYKFHDDEAVYAVGWGDSNFAGTSEQLQATQVWTLNQHSCRLQYAALGVAVSEAMVCAGWRSRAHCRAYTGGPLLHNNVVVGLGSWGHDCDATTYPGVNLRVSRYSAWISAAVA